MSATNKRLNSFSLLRLQKSCYYPPILVDFTPMPKPNLGPISITPKFNKDSNYWTEAFVNPYQEVKHTVDHERQVEAQKEKFLQKVHKVEEEINKSSKGVRFTPRGDQFCSICGSNFNSYWQHINSLEHLKKIKRNRANTYIHDLCMEYLPKKMGTTQKHHKNKENHEKHKAKKIKKPSKRNINKESYRREDFVINLPKEFFSKDLLQGSTNGIVSLEIKHDNFRNSFI